MPPTSPVASKTHTQAVSELNVAGRMQPIDVVLDGLAIPTEVLGQLVDRHPPAALKKERFSSTFVDDLPIYQ